MTIGRTRVSILIAGMCAVLLSASSAHAALSAVEFKCFKTITKATLAFTNGRVKLLQKCINENLKAAGTCAEPDAGAIAKLDSKLASTIDKGCVLANFQLAEMGFPGQCSDANSGDGFTVADLKACLKTSHENLVDQMIDLEYDATIVNGPLTGTALTCQKEIAKNSAAVVAAILKNVQKCRIGIMDCKTDPNTLEIVCKIPGISAENCATDEPKTAAAVTKAKNKALAKIQSKCSPADALAVKACEPDQPDGATTAACEVAAHVLRTDDASENTAADLIDFEFARVPKCGDNVVNTLNEECDGTDDAACDGQCGSAEVPDGFFACLCKDKPRAVVAEHSNADTDNGWNGISSDGAVVEGGGYIVDLYDCDGFGNCNVGPSCSLPPHSPCAVASNAALGTTSNSICAGLGQGTCRKERTATGPHCYLDIQKRCNENGDTTTCTSPGDFCQTTFHGAPVAAAAGGVAVCNVSRFSEDIVGTININTGASSMKVRQRAVTWNPVSQAKPCPVCGGFCASGSRDLCTVDGDCPGLTGPCITEPVCSDGPRQDKPCRQGAPFGGPLPFYGTTSMDCPQSGSLITSNGGGLDINPTRTTGSVSLLPTASCVGAGFTGNACLGGTSEGRPCTVASECPGGACSPQCFCFNQVKPNDCAAACVGGGSDGASCVDDVDCPGGFCHPGDCRVDLGDLDSNQEGICTAGPFDDKCSITTNRGCNSDADCQPPLCTFCQPTETCVGVNRACFVNSGIVRIGTPGIPERETAGVYCVPANSAAINSSAGFPGPGALIQRETLIITP